MAISKFPNGQAANLNSKRVKLGSLGRYISSPHLLIKWSNTHALKLLPGPAPSKVDSLAFSLRDPNISQNSSIGLSQLRLFSAGGGAELLEWNLEQGRIVVSSRIRHAFPV